MSRYGLEHHGIVQAGNIHWNLEVAQLVEQAIERGEGQLTNTGALNAMTAPRTGRSPRDKWVVDAPEIHEEIWWGKVNVAMPDETYLRLREEALAYLRGKDLFVVDAFVGADIDKLDKIGMDKVKEELLSKGLSAEQVGTIEKYLSITGTDAEKISQAEQLLGSDEEGRKGLEEMKYVHHFSAIPLKLISPWQEV